jgi:plasmid stabilization system protein ParE
VNYELKFRHEAEIDLQKAAKWYEQQKEGLGFDFLNEVEKKCEVINHTPLIFEVVYKKLRRVVIERFPFNVFYLVEDKTIVVVAVIHGSRHPKKWQKRI